jgi:hypothetical protein
VLALVTRRFFELNPLDAGMIATAVIASAIAIGALTAAGVLGTRGPSANRAARRWRLTRHRDTARRPPGQSERL